MPMAVFLCMYETTTYFKKCSKFIRKSAFPFIYPNIFQP